MTPAGWPASLVLAGAGRMGGALLRGWLDHGLPPSAVRVVDPHLDPGGVADLQRRGVGLDTPAEAPAVLVLAIKPQTFAATPGALASLAGAGTLVVSILAGVTLGNLRAVLPGAGSIVRAMPNLPAAVGRGISGVAAEAATTEVQRATAERLLSAVGGVEWLDEALIDAVTAVSGSGPAYVFHLAECLAAAGVAAGLPGAVAARLARATIEGAGALLAAEPDRTATALREAVTSPGGTTAAALAVLGEENALESLVRRAVEAARRRAGELAR